MANFFFLNENKITIIIYVAPFSERTQSAVTSLLLVNQQNHVASYRHAIRKEQQSYRHLMVVRASKRISTRLLLCSFSYLVNVAHIHPAETVF